MMIGTMEITEPANIMFHAAALSPMFLRETTPTVKGLKDGLDIVKIIGIIYSFHPPLNDKRATAERTGFKIGRIIFQ